MVCPPIRGDIPIAFASRLSFLQLYSHGITFFYTTYTNEEHAHCEIVCALIGKAIGKSPPILEIKRQTYIRRSYMYKKAVLY